METITYSIPAIHCGHCVHTIQLEVGDIAGVNSVVADETGRSATVTFAPPATEDQIIAMLKEINYPPEGHDLIQIG
jgi:copper chaperone CopZ